MSLNSACEPYLPNIEIETVYKKGIEKEPSIRIIIAKPNTNPFEIVFPLSEARELYKLLGEELEVHE